jgi:hypothetical protein
MKPIPSPFKFLKMREIFFSILSFVFITTNAQTADEIIQRYSKSVGGLAAFKAVKTLKMIGTVTTQGMDLPLTIQIINGRAVKNEVDAMGQKVINSYKDGKGWKINPFAGAPTATDMTNDELIDFKTQTMLATNLMDHKARGHKVELLGQEDVEGIKTHKIKLTNKDDNKAYTYYINTADNMLIKSVGSRNLQGQEVDIETFYSNVKEFNGLKFALTRSQKISGQVFQEININTVELNVTIDEKIFDK